MKRVRLVVGKDVRDEELQKPMHVDGGFVRVGRQLVAFVDVGKADIDGLVNEQQGRVPGPAIGVVISAIAMLIDQTGADFLEQADHAGAARAAGHPKSEGVAGGVILAFKIPEEEMLGSDVQPAGVLGRAGGTERFVLLADADGVIRGMWAADHAKLVRVFRLQDGLGGGIGHTQEGSVAERKHLVG